MCRILFIASCLLALVLYCQQACYAAEATTRPNVLFVIFDDLNCDLGCYGHPLVQSPNIDALARRGVRFQHAYCQYPLCGPSRASFMTGLYPDQTLIHENAIYVRRHLPDVVTLSQMFRGAGYFATRIGKIFHYHVPRHIGTSGHDDPWSWNRTINPRGRDVDDEPHIFSLIPGHFGATLSWLAAEGSDEEQTDGIAASAAVRLLNQYADERRPFFLAVGLYRPHTPFVAPKKYFDMYPTDRITVPQVPPGYLETLPPLSQERISHKTEQVNLPDKLARQAIQAYYASITFADAQLGRVLDTLEETGLAANTIVVVTSDHGYHMGEHGHYQKATLFENATRIPLIIVGPGVLAAGGVATSFAEMVDFYPTLAELCGLNPPEHLAGVSLVPALTNPEAKIRASAFSQYQSGYSIRTSRFRYTRWGANGAGGGELYDHATDPEELHNLIADPERSADVERLQTMLRARIHAAAEKPAGLVQLDVVTRQRK